MTQEEIEAAIASLEATKLAKLTGRGRLKVGSPEGGSVEFQAITIGEINQELANLRIQLAKLTGGSSGVGPIFVTSGGKT